MDIAPCPFCGKPAEYVCEDDHHGDYFRLGCIDEDCPAHWTYYTEPQENAEKCIARWNSRILGVAQSARETALEAAALDFIAKVERGEARSTKSYAAFKAALDTGLPTSDDVRGILAVPHNGCSAGIEVELDFSDPLTSSIMGAARLHTHDHTMAYSITREVLAVVRAQPQTSGVPVDQVARTLALSYGRDPDALTEWTEMCDAHNRPVPIWKVYEEQAEALLASYSITRPQSS